MDTTKPADRASTGVKTWRQSLASVLASVWSVLRDPIFVFAASVFVIIALLQTWLYMQFTTDYACLQLTDAGVSIVYPRWLARDGSQQQAPVVIQLDTAALCADQPAAASAINEAVGAASSPQLIATPIPPIVSSPLATRSASGDTLEQTSLAQPVSLLVASGVEIAVVQGLDLSQSSPFTVTLDTTNREQTLIVSYLPGAPQANSQHGVTINGQELPIELEQVGEQRWRVLVSTIFGPAGVALAALGFFLVVLQEERKQKESREIEALEKAVERCSVKKLSASEFLEALDRLTQLTKHNAKPFADKFASCIVPTFRADPWYLIENSARWEENLRHLYSLADRPSRSSIETILTLLAWYGGNLPSKHVPDEVIKWKDEYLIGFAWNWQWRNLVSNAEPSRTALHSRWKERINDNDFVLGILTSQAVLEKAGRSSDLRKSFLNYVIYVVSRSTKEEKDTPSGGWTIDRNSKLGQEINSDLETWIRNKVIPQPDEKWPESVAVELAKVVADLSLALKIGHRRKNSDRPQARMLWPLDNEQKYADPNYTHNPENLDLFSDMLSNTPLVIFQQPSTEGEEPKREGTRVRISLQWQLYSRLNETEPVLPVFAYLPSNLVEAGNPENIALVWLCRCVANEVISYLSEEPVNRFNKFSAEVQERMARLLAVIGYDVAAGPQCLFQPVPDADLLDVDAYYGGLLRTDNFLKLRILMDAADPYVAWVEPPEWVDILTWTETLLRMAGIKKAMILIDNLEQPLADGVVTAAEYAKVLAPLLAQAPRLAPHRIGLLMFLPAIIKPDLEREGVRFSTDTALTDWFRDEFAFGAIKASHFDRDKM